VFLAFALVVNFLFTILFCRNENVAIRMGWDKQDQDELCNDSLSDLDDDSPYQNQNNVNPERSYTIDDVLYRVTTDIQQTESIMRNNKKPIVSNTEMNTIPESSTIATHGQHIQKKPKSYVETV